MDVKPRYFRGPDGDCLMLHNPEDGQVDALEAMGAEEISHARYREIETDRMGTDEGPPTGGYEELATE